MHRNARRTGRTALDSAGCGGHRRDGRGVTLQLDTDGVAAERMQDELSGLTHNGHETGTRGDDVLVAGGPAQR